jgi:hypothetical protein
MEAEVARYFFDVTNGHRLVDPSGIDCRNDHEALKAGVVIAQQIAADAPCDQPRHVAVLAASGRKWLKSRSKATAMKSEGRQISRLLIPRVRAQTQELSDERYL